MDLAHTPSLRLFDLLAPHSSRLTLPSVVEVVSGRLLLPLSTLNPPPPPLCLQRPRCALLSRDYYRMNHLLWVRWIPCQTCGVILWSVSFAIVHCLVSIFDFQAAIGARFYNKICLDMGIHPRAPVSNMFPAGGVLCGGGGICQTPLLQGGETFPHLAGDTPGVVACSGLSINHRILSRVGSAFVSVSLPPAPIQFAMCPWHSPNHCSLLPALFSVCKVIL